MKRHLLSVAKTLEITSHLLANPTWHLLCTSRSRLHSGGRMKKNKLNPDQFKCDWPEFKGELQKNWKDFSDEDLTEIEGDYEKFVSMVQKRCRDKEEDVVRWANDWYSKREQHEAAARHSTISRNQM